MSRVISMAFLSCLAAWLGAGWFSSPRIGASARQRDPAPGEGPAKKVALIVGINQYKSATIPALRGAVNDANGMKQLLVERFGFAAADVLVLTGAQATRERIVRGFREHLIARSGPGTVAVFHFSGHGSRMIDVDGDELDGWDETIVPYDSRQGGVFDIDDDLQGELFDELTARTRYVTAIFDSGLTGFGVADPSDNSEMSAGRDPLYRARQVVTRRLRGIPLDRRHPPEAPPRPRRDEEAPHAYTRIFASQDGDQAYESSEGDRPGGLLTRFFLEEAGRGDDRGATYQDVMDRVTVGIRKVQPGQRPRLDGDGIDRVMFGVASVATPPYILATPDRLDALLLAGRIDGLAKSAVYDLYPPGSKSLQDRALAVARVVLDGVGPRESRGRLIRGDAIPPASRAVEREPGVEDHPVRLRLEDRPGDPSPALREIRARIGRMKAGTGPFLLVERAQPADLVLRAEMPRDHPHGATILRLLSDDERRTIREMPEGEPRAAERLLEQILEMNLWPGLRERQLVPVAGPRAISKIYALFIGINHYRMGLTLRGCVNDAVALEEAIKPIAQTANLHNEKATREAILDEIGDMMNRAHHDDLIILFISSHGTVGYNDFFVVPHDFDLGKPLGTGLSFGLIAAALSSKPGVKSLIVLDSCHSGQTSFDIARYAGIDLESSVMVSASPEEVAAETTGGDRKHFGLFTRYLIEGLDGVADDDRDGKVTIREVFDYAYVRTKKDSGGRQHPVYFGNLNQNIVLKDLGSDLLKATARSRGGAAGPGSSGGR